MGSLLIESWLGDSDAMPIHDDASIAEAREAVRARGSAIGLDAPARERMASAVSELARNQLVHASGGMLGFRAITRGGVAGLEVIAADAGSGIADPTAAYRGADRTTGSLGVGLSAAHRQVDELDIDVRLGEGTCIRARTFAASVARSESAILARAVPGETVIGDHAAIVRDDGGCTVGVVDGLGHGVLAREASDRAIATMIRRADQRPDAILAECHAALADTRGAVMAVSRCEGREVVHAAVGNIATRVIGVGGVARPLPSTPGTLGAAFPRRVPTERIAVTAHQVLVMFTDGIGSRMDLTVDPDLIRQPALVIAHFILERFGRQTDDALVAVMR